jgi:hypothetical protein
LQNFYVTEDHDAANYIHVAEELAELHGRKYSKKRNLIAQFLESHPQWEVTGISPECGNDCISLLLAMARASKVEEDSWTLQSEVKALEFTILNLARLEQTGLIVRVGGKPVGFAIFEPLGPEMAAVHFEKGDRKFKGGFQLVNRETAKAITMRGLKLINREEDLGNEGLRQAKQSYHPSELRPVYNLAFKKF